MVNVLAGHVGLVELYRKVACVCVPAGPAPLIRKKLFEVGHVSGAGLLVAPELLGEVHAEVAAFFRQRILVEGG